MDCSRHLPSLRPNLRSSCPSGECRIALAMDSTGKVAKSSPQLPPQAASAAQIAAVLGNDDLLREILLRVDFPNYLVRAATVSKRWLRHASDPAFLRRFRRRNPPRLLGFYVASTMRFVPLPQPPELAAVIRRGKFDLCRGGALVWDCRNGRLITSYSPGDTVYRPLHPERGASAFSQPPHIPAMPHDNLTQYGPHFLLHDDGGEDVAILAVFLMRSDQQAGVQLMDFQAGAWSECRNSDLMKLPEEWGCRQFAFLANGKIYVICTRQYIIGLDVQSMRMFSIKLPNGVESKYNANIALSRAEGSGFCLVHVNSLNSFQISAWHYTMDHSSTGNWELIDTFCLRQVLGPNADPTWWSEGALVQLGAVGDNADFVFFSIQNKVFHLHISSRAVKKVYELSDSQFLDEVWPFMMVWPPTFPTLNGGHDNDE